MDWKFILLVIILTLVFIYIILGKFFYNPYKLYICVGKKGSGKSTLLTKLAYKYTKKGQCILTNTTLNLPEKQMQLVEYVGALDLWCTDCTNKVVLLDETGLDFDSRMWETFPPEMKKFFVFQRKKRCTVYLFSQNLDVDKCIRNLSDRLLLTRSNGWLCVAQWIDRSITFTHASDFKGSSIADELKPRLSFIFTFVPRWRKYFDTNTENFVSSQTVRSKKR